MNREPHETAQPEWTQSEWEAGFAQPAHSSGAASATAGVVVAVVLMGIGAIFLANLPQAHLAGNGAPSATANADAATQSARSLEANSQPRNPRPVKVAAAARTDSKFPALEKNSSANVVSRWGPRLKPHLGGDARRQPTDTTVQNGFAPRLNPRRIQQAPVGSRAAKPAAPKTAQLNTANPKARPQRLAQKTLTPNTTHQTPVFFESDMKPTRIPPPPLAVALATDIDAAPREITVSMKRGETFVDVLKRAGVNANDRNSAAAAFGQHQSLRRLRPGQLFTITTGVASKTLFQDVSETADYDQHLLALKFRPDSESRIELARAPGGAIQAEKITVPITTRLAAINGRIDGSLFLSAKRAGAPDSVVAKLANMFAYDIDFQRDIFGGDEFEAIFELLYDDEGVLIGSGDILYGRMNWRGKNKEKGYYRFAQDDGRVDYFDRAGQSARRLLMKTPIDGARLSSGFGTRKHPILGYRKAHKGVDFAARRGTPIYAAGDGVVERANRFGSFGNYIRIRHANGYKTAYAHLNGFRKGIRAGKRVRQGDVIGYVGTTGRSTGPHLHYEVHHKGRAVNPQRLKIATGVKLKGGDFTAFKKIRDEIDNSRTPEKGSSGVLARDEVAGGVGDAL